MAKRMLQAINKLMNQWKVEHDAEDANQRLHNQYAQQLQGTTTWASTTTAPLNQQAMMQYTNAATYQMGGQLGALGSGTGLYGSTSTYGHTSPAYQWTLTDAHMEKLMAFMAKAMERSWTCSKCARQYAPLTPDCEFCNLIERLEGVEADDTKAAI